MLASEDTDRDGEPKDEFSLSMASAKLLSAVESLKLLSALEHLVPQSLAETCLGPVTAPGALGLCPLRGSSCGRGPEELSRRREGCGSGSGSASMARCSCNIAHPALERSCSVSELWSEWPRAGAAFPGSSHSGKGGQEEAGMEARRGEAPLNPSRDGLVPSAKRFNLNCRLSSLAS